MAAEGELMIAENHPHGSVLARAQIEGGQFAADLVNDPPAVFQPRRFMSVEFDQTKLLVAQLKKLERAGADAKMLFNLRAVDRMGKRERELIADADVKCRLALLTVKREAQGLSSGEGTGQGRDEQPERGGGSGEGAGYHGAPGTLIPFSL